MPVDVASELFNFTGNNANISGFVGAFPLKEVLDSLFFCISLIEYICAWVRILGAVGRTCGIFL